MEYGIRTRERSGGAGGPSGWLESALASAAFVGHVGHHNPLGFHHQQQLPSGAALLLNSLQSLQSLQSSAAAMELVWKSGKREPPDDEGRSPDDERPADVLHGTDAGGEDRGSRDDEDEDDAEDKNVDEENEVSAESWKDMPMPVLSSWMLGAYTSMLGRLSAATAALEAAESSNISSDSDSQSELSSSSDMLSRESSPASSVRRAYSRVRSTTATPRTRKKKRPSNVKSKKNGAVGESGKEVASTEAAASDASSSSQGKKRSLALQRVRYEREEYRCSLCSYACTIEKAFQRHLRAHARGTATESRVSCAVCGADRSSEVDLNKHMRRHRDNRYFCCDICIFRTVQLKKLIQHRRMHTGEKPHLCPHCAYRSARRDNLRSHVRRVHKKENLYCDTFSPRGMFIAPKLHDLDRLQPSPREEDRNEVPDSLPAQQS